MLKNTCPSKTKLSNDINVNNVKKVINPHCLCCECKKKLCIFEEQYDRFMKRLEKSDGISKNNTQTGENNLGNQNLEEHFRTETNIESKISNSLKKSVSGLYQDEHRMVQNELLSGGDFESVIEVLKPFEPRLILKDVGTQTLPITQGINSELLSLLFAIIQEKVSQKEKVCKEAKILQNVECATEKKDFIIVDAFNISIEGVDLATENKSIQVITSRPRILPILRTKNSEKYIFVDTSLILTKSNSIPFAEAEIKRRTTVDNSTSKDTIVEINKMFGNIRRSGCTSTAHKRPTTRNTRVLPVVFKSKVTDTPAKTEPKTNNEEISSNKPNKSIEELNNFSENQRAPNISDQNYFRTKYTDASATRQSFDAKTSHLAKNSTEDFLYCFLCKRKFNIGNDYSKKDDVHFKTLYFEQSLRYSDTVVSDSRNSKTLSRSRIFYCSDCCLDVNINRT